jgi:transcriptional antiterminator NusG
VQLGETRRFSQMLVVGDTVKIVEGAFYDFDGTIQEVRPSEEKVRVAISIFGRAETIELDFSQIKPATAN